MYLFRWKFPGSLIGRNVANVAARHRFVIPSSHRSVYKLQLGKSERRQGSVTRARNSDMHIATCSETSIVVCQGQVVVLRSQEF